MSVFGLWGWLLQAWHLGLAAGLLLAAAWLAFGVLFPFHKAAACVCACLALFILGRAEGERAASNRCQELAVRTQLDRAVARAAELQRQAAAQAVLAARAGARAEAAEKETAAAAKRVEDYEAELAKRPVDRRCLLDGGDLRQLR